jgi:hypothetical protein
MDRRTLLTAAGALGLGAAFPAFAADDEKTAARDAWFYALPLIEMATTRARFLADGGRINAFAPVRDLTDHTGRWVTTPNNDTLYASAWIDLTQGPVTLSVPDMGGRYWSIAVMDMFTNNNVVLGGRTVGSGPATFTFVGPGEDSLPADAVPVATPHAWVLARVLVDGPAEVPLVRTILDAITLRGPTTTPKTPAYAERSASPDDYFASARALLASDPAPMTDLRLLRRAAAVLGPKAGPCSDSAKAGVAEAQGLVKAAFGRQTYVQGWSYPKSTLGDYGQDYLYRAAVALAGLGALPPAEAMYMRAEGDGRGLYNDDQVRRLSLPAAVPVDAFWSLSMYEATADGQFFFADNPLHRYAIGDRTPGLTRNADGSLDLWISRGDPGGARSANWLPAPKTGPYGLFFRAYLPKAELLDGRWRLPALAVA